MKCKIFIVTDPYIRVLLITPAGRLLKKKKTSFRSGSGSPVWNETLIFDLPPKEVSKKIF